MKNRYLVPRSEVFSMHVFGELMLATGSGHSGETFGNGTGSLDPTSDEDVILSKKFGSAPPSGSSDMSHHSLWDDWE